MYIAICSRNKSNSAVVMPVHSSAPEKKITKKPFVWTTEANSFQECL